MEIAPSKVLIDGRLSHSERLSTSKGAIAMPIPLLSKAGRFCCHLIRTAVIQQKRITRPDRSTNSIPAPTGGDGANAIWQRHFVAIQVPAPTTCPRSLQATLPLPELHIHALYSHALMFSQRTCHLPSFGKPGAAWAPASVSFQPPAINATAVSSAPLPGKYARRPGR